MKIGFLHTAAVHVGAFDRLLEGSGAEAIHHVDPALLASAQTEGLAAVKDAVTAAIAGLGGADVILCSCSTLGPLMDDMSGPPILRIDQPAFAQAILHGPRVLVVICLESTRVASLDSLTFVAGERKITPTVLLCGEAWTYFTTNDMDGFYHAIATDVRTAVQRDLYDSVVLAQASMAGAAHLLVDISLPVLTTPAAAIARAIEIAQSSR